MQCPQRMFVTLLSLLLSSSLLLLQVLVRLLQHQYRLTHGRANSLGADSDAS